MTRWMTAAAIIVLGWTLGVAHGTLKVQAAQAQAARDGEVTLVGCIELERDYRARKESGRGGVLGSGVGVGNEFVLTNAKPAQPGRRGGGPAAGVDYQLSGKLEKDFLRYVGRQVEVIGKVETGGAMSTINVSLWHPVGDYCPAK
jgi:hypothetical protein